MVNIVASPPVIGERRRKHSGPAAKQALGGAESSAPPAIQPYCASSPLTQSASGFRRVPRIRLADPVHVAGLFCGVTGGFWANVRGRQLLETVSSRPVRLRPVAPASLRRIAARSLPPAHSLRPRSTARRLAPL